MVRLFGCNIYEYDEPTDMPVVLCLGFFDCFHNGHRRVIDKAASIAAKTGAEVAAFTFRGNPHAVLGSTRKPVFTFDERVFSMSAFGVSDIFFAIPTRDFFAIEAQDFVDTLFDRHNVVAVVAGTDYTFGAHAAGNAEMLAAACRERGVECELCEMLEYEPGKKIASRTIEKAIEKGDVDTVNKWLPSGYFMLGQVVHGRGEGAKFGFPTANLRFPQDKQRLGSGVYATKVTVDAQYYPAVTNVGGHPTFAEDDSYTVESLLIGWHGDLYGKTISVTFLTKLRDIVHFDDPSALKAQIDRDIERAIALKSGGNK